jgi:hypothetical protein
LNAGCAPVATTDHRSAGAWTVFQGESVTETIENAIDNDTGTGSGNATRVMISDAGLVLTHPMHRHLFEQSDLLSRSASGAVTLRNRSAARHGMLLLAHLCAGGNAAAGDDGAGDDGLVLAGLLCGLTPEQAAAESGAGSGAESAAKPGQLSELEMYRCEELLRAMMGNWPVMANASPAALRESFLNRQGRLDQAADGSWRLTVQRRPLDILLDRLPWTFQTIQHEWMQAPLRVSW